MRSLYLPSWLIFIRYFMSRSWGSTCFTHLMYWKPRMYRSGRISRWSTTCCFEE